jgi:hypothetical protein
MCMFCTSNSKGAVILAIQERYDKIHFNFITHTYFLLHVKLGLTVWSISVTDRPTQSLDLCISIRTHLIFAYNTTDIERSCLDFSTRFATTFLPNEIFCTVRQLQFVTTLLIVVF